MKTTDEILNYFQDVKKNGKGYMARCPIHDDHNPSLSITEENNKTLFYCHAGCKMKDIIQAVGLSWQDILPERETAKINSKDNGKGYTIDEITNFSWVEKTYEYKDEDENPLFLVIRKSPKGFAQYRYIGEDRWKAGLDGQQPVIYRLPQIIKAIKTDKKIYLVEGEKDVNNLVKLGVEATCNPMGAKKWKEHYNQYLSSAKVVILPDNDEVGKEHAEIVANSLWGIAKEIKILNLPNLQEKEDVSDWLEKGGTKEELERLTEETQLWEKEEQLIVTEEDFHQTDLGNALRLVSYFKENIRYCNKFKAWFIWDRKKWKQDITYELRLFAKETVKKMYEEALQKEDDKRKKLIKWALLSENHQKLLAMVELTKAEVPITPDEFDQNKWLINCQNGVLDLETGEQLIPHEEAKELYITKIIPVQYNKDAKYPMWSKFLSEIFNNNQELIKYVQMAVGYSLTGDISEQCLFFLYGRGANGKSTFLEVIRYVLGDYAYQTDFSTFIIQKNEPIRNDIARLAGARFVSSVEVEEGKRLAETLIKQITGGDPLAVRFLHGEFFEFYPTFKIFFAANHKPTIRGTDDAIWRRIQTIPFITTIPEEKRIRNFAEYLKEEAEGIFAWAVEGLNLLQKEERLKPPACVKEATKEYREEMDILSEFLNEKCEVAHNNSVTVKELYEAYGKWCVENQENAVSKLIFNNRLTERGFIKNRGTGNKPVWRGIGLVC